ncbi:hypothetical protein AB0H73_10145 [Streptomyces olivoreticuli]
MKLTELITRAQAALAEHGDLDVLAIVPGCGCCGGGEYDGADTSVDMTGTAGALSFVVDTV